MADKPTGEELTQLWNLWEHTWGIITGIGAAIVAVVVATKKIWDYQKTTADNHFLLVGVVDQLADKFHSFTKQMQDLYTQTVEQNKEYDRQAEAFREEMRRRMAANEKLLGQMQTTVAGLEKTNERILHKLDMA